MIDFKVPSSQRAIAALEEGDTKISLLRYGRMLTGSEVDSEDLLADAFGLVCDPQEGRPWDPDRGSFKAHMRIVMYDLGRNQRRGARARREVLDPNLDSSEHALDPAIRVDDRLEDARERARLEALGKRLRAGLSGLALEVFDLRCEGVEGEALARTLGCTDQDVRAANKRIARLAEKVLAEESKEIAARMRALRAGAKPMESS